MTYTATARTNYVRVIDRPGLEVFLALFEDQVKISDRGAGKESEICLLATGENGVWPTEAIFDDGDKLERFKFSWNYVMTFVAEGEVLVIMESGADKQRCIRGSAEAYQRRGDDVDFVDIDLNQIYEKAAQAFGVRQDKISIAEY